MPVYLEARIRAVPGKLRPLVELLSGELIPLMQGQGWKLQGLFVGKTGPINTIINLWELEDMEHFRRAYGGFVGHPDFPSIRARLDSHVQEEVLTFLDRRD
ncbi:NIPSNAP family protein [Sandaracinobacter sp. RS1-74]|uniref:NIPSNAP family protein n=1 Tax=Sandaracinobacteroides sayramensis TaxID=2913411 RepID=UPI001EDA9103|nr:NIPSNAP family protein [Sandaracinobacteroides sayramensis]MCG2840541.1 NIPSNAP family protein [Sandaracinobacteroides sayramensis]